MKPLPFSDDFRDLSSVIPLDQNQDDIEETKDITDKIVKKLTFKVCWSISFPSSPSSSVPFIRYYTPLPLKPQFDPRNFENPALRTHYNVIESLALGREAQPVEDSTKPPVERIDKKIGGELSSFVSLKNL